MVSISSSTPVVFAAESIKWELETVENDLATVQVELDSLLTKQTYLLGRQKQLLSRLESLERTQEQKALHAQDWEDGIFPWNTQVLYTLKSVFKIDAFRPLQRSCINATLSNQDVILIMPTGAGKSLCYQLPAVVSKGLTLVISPLVSLMQDQLLAVKNFGIESYALSYSTSREDVSFIHAQMALKQSNIKLLYVTPERIAKSKRFMTQLEKAYETSHLTRIVIDEIHCASQWGHDFRPDYKLLGILKRQFPSIPILGLTATASAKVLDEVREMLSLKDCLVLRASYNRANLFYEVRLKSSVHKVQIESMAALIKRRFPSSSGIIYCFSRVETQEVASGLCERGITAAPYNSDLPPERRSEVHMMWLNNAIQVIVATVAFGMGIDKPDVRFVMHHSISKSMLSYYQESGRAGRDNKPAHCIVYFRPADAYRQSSKAFTENTGLPNLYAMLRYCLNKVECRRAVIARCFGEKWSPSDCKTSCDICSLHPLTSSGTEENAASLASSSSTDSIGTLDNTESASSKAASEPSSNADRIVLATETQGISEDATLTSADSISKEATPVLSPSSTEALSKPATAECASGISTTESVRPKPVTIAKVAATEDSSTTEEISKAATPESDKSPATSSDGFTPRQKPGNTYVCVKEDITEHCKTMVTIIKEAEVKERKMTALKVVEAWKVKDPSKKPSVEERESLVLEAVLSGVLQETFHFTPYSTISYISLGRKAEAVVRGVTKVKVRKRVVDNTSASSKNGASADSALCDGSGSRATTAGVNGKSAESALSSDSAKSTTESKEVAMAQPEAKLPTASQNGASNSISKTRSVSDQVRGATKRKALPPRKISKDKPKATPPSSERTSEQNGESRELQDSVKSKLPKMLLPPSGSSSSGAISVSDELDFLPLRKRPRLIKSPVMNRHPRTSCTSIEGIGEVIEIDSD